MTLKMPGGRPPKSTEGRADALIRFRVRTEQKELFQKAAHAADKSLTDWILDQLVRNAKPPSSPRRPQKT